MKGWEWDWDVGLGYGYGPGIRDMGLECEDMDGYRMGYGEVRYIWEGLWIWDGYGINMGRIWEGTGMIV